MLRYLSKTSWRYRPASPATSDARHDNALDPPWNPESEAEAEPFGKEEIAFYQCDHLRTPQELTDHEGKVARSAQYKAWGKRRRRSAKSKRNAALQRAGSQMVVISETEIDYVVLPDSWLSMTAARLSTTSGIYGSLIHCLSNNVWRLRSDNSKSGSQISRSFSHREIQ